MSCSEFAENLTNDLKLIENYDIEGITVFISSAVFQYVQINMQKCRKSTETCP